jgi:hypothetical protein
VSNYENAPATKLLATHCACCGRSLLDAESVEAGMGPTCRKVHGYNRAQAEPDWEAVLRLSDGLLAVAEIFPAGDARVAEASWRLGGLETRRVANLAVHRIAVAQRGPAALQLAAVVRALGFTRLADRVEERLVQVRIELAGDEYVVHAPYSETFNARLGENRPARRWDPENKCWRVRAPFRGFLFAALKAAFPGVAAVGPKGSFVL